MTVPGGHGIIATRKVTEMSSDEVRQGGGASPGRSAADPEVRRMLDALGKAIRQAARTSSEVGDAVRRIRDEGYSLYLVLDLRPRRGRDGPRLELTDEPRAVPPAPATLAEPSYRLTPADVAFLESVGIDATRPARRRRG